MNEDAYISIRNVCRNYGEVKAVVDANLEIGKGEFFGLLGSSGSGKSTLLRMMAGFEELTSGELMIDGQSMAHVPPYRRPVNMVFQNYAIFPHLNVFQNIAYGLRKERLGKQEVKRRVEGALEMIRLQGYGERRISEMSGGQRQRVALARAIVKQPKALLLDEPLGALDKRLREDMQVELRNLQRTLGITFLLVTHDQEEALTMSDRIAVMSGGRIQEIGTPKELYERPNNHFTAQFLGQMNFLPARISETRSDSATVVIEGLGPATVSADSVRNLVGPRICVGIRPENLTLVSLQSGAAMAQGTLLNQVYLGERYHLHIKIDGVEDPLVVSQQNGNVGEGVSLQEGHTVGLRWSPTSLLVFNELAPT